MHENSEHYCILNAFTPGFSESVFLAYLLFENRITQTRYIVVFSIIVFSLLRSFPQVKNTLGYDTLGHCFFLEDGIEQRNTFFHNLGLLTRPGTLLPTDRNETVCTSMRDKVYRGYTPSPSTECK